MKSKVERVKDSIDNVEAAIDYYLEDIDNQFLQKKMSKNDYLKLVKSLNIIKKILLELRFNQPFGNKTLDEIRRINLSISSLYEEDDYNIVFSNIVRSNERLCSGAKNRDRELLGDLKKIFNGLSNFYKYRLSKAIKSGNNSIDFKDKNFDNVMCIIENYLSAKYNFKKVSFERLNISDDYKQLLDTCTLVLKSNKINDQVKNIYISMRNLVIRLANAEIITRELEKIIILCNQHEFLNILTITKKMLIKYTSIYNNCKGKYNALLDYLMVNGIDGFSLEVDNNITQNGAELDESIQK